MVSKIFDVIVIGGGQAALALGYYLRKAGLDFIIVDDQPEPGGAWRHAWDSLRLFSPAALSSLPGILMVPNKQGEYPHRDEVLEYLRKYEELYQLPVYRPHHVQSVTRDQQHACLLVGDGKYQWRARAVASATGTWSKSHIPTFPGQEQFQGRQLHSAHYRRPDGFKDQRVLIVGGGNSGAQILADVAAVALTTWVTQSPPAFLPDDVDGRVLFERATARIQGKSQGEPVGGIGDIVMVPAVKVARDQGLLTSKPLFAAFTATGIRWQDGTSADIDAVIWCTGFRPALDHLKPLGVIDDKGRVQVSHGQADKEPRLWLFGYGDWASPGSATLIGAARSTREITPKLVQYIKTN